jgi:hypothetical protein
MRAARNRTRSNRRSFVTALLGMTTLWRLQGVILKAVTHGMVFNP